MPENGLPDDVEEGLEQALAAMQDLQSRLESGEDFDEKELVMISRMIATKIEEVRMTLEEAVGPIDPELIRAEMKEKLSPEEYEEWLVNSEERQKLRDEIAREKVLKEQLGG